MIDIGFIILLVLINGIFSMSELAMFAARKVRLQQRANSGDRTARRAMAIREHPTRFLSTVQVGITLVGILAGAVGGATLSEDLAAWLARFPLLEAYSAQVALGIIVLCVTYVSVVFGELIPKRLALSHSETLACAVAPPMHVLSLIGAPAVRILTASTDGLLRILGVRVTDSPKVTEEDIKVLVAEGALTGEVHAAEHELVKSVFELADRSVGSLMTPRPDIVWLDLNDPSEVHLRKLGSSPYSRFPVARGNLDQLIGVVEVRDLLSRALTERRFNIEDCVKQPLIVPESASALQLLEKFKASPLHVALVVDEYGGIEGLVTRIDVLKALAGAFVESEDDEPGAVQRADGSWLVDGSLAIEDFRKLVNFDEAPDERGEYQTLAGLVMAQLGEIPKPGAAFEYRRLRFEVLDMDRHRVDKVAVTPLDRGEVSELRDQI